MGLTRTVHQTDLDEFVILNLDPYEIAYYSQKSPNKTGPNEDSLGIAVKNHRLFLAVADGVGGSPKGEEASTVVIETIIHSFATKSIHHEQGARNVIVDSIELANQKLIEKNNGERTTLTAGEIENGILRSYQVGDSALIISGQKGLIKYRTNEHSPVGYAVQSGLLTEKEALVHPERHLVSNVVGDAELSIELGPHIPLSKKDTILLATDGLLDNFLLEDLIEIIRKESLSEVMTRLCDFCQGMREEKNRHKFLKIDDISFIVCRQE